MKGSKPPQLGAEVISSMMSSWKLNDEHGKKLKPRPIEKVRKLDWPGSDKLNDEQYGHALMRRYKLKGEGPEVEDEPFPKDNVKNESASRALLEVPRKNDGNTHEELGLIWPN